jgi:hypothetical protein
VGKNPHAAVVHTVDRGERGGWTSGRFRSFMLSALICTRAFLTVRQSLTQDRYGFLLALSDSHASLTLRQSATLRGRAPTRRTHPRGACLSRRARGLGPPDPRWHETCGESGQGARVGLRASRLLQCRGAYEASQHEMRPPGSTAPHKKGARRCN